ncbi:hypothetical protein BaRGS_00024327 [Batillaria attramentaria]|uniref:Uncharacterized protein n=1 Tax=Batillaria attramentaria TaxID=370345 RepID=A0ABD0KBM5_9CAEN
MSSKASRQVKSMTLESQIEQSNDLRTVSRNEPPSQCSRNAMRCHRVFVSRVMTSDSQGIMVSIETNTAIGMIREREREKKMGVGVTATGQNHLSLMREAGVVIDTDQLNDITDTTGTDTEFRQQFVKYHAGRAQ